MVPDHIRIPLMVHDRTDEIKGKVRAKLEVPVDIDPADLEKQARAAVADRLGGKEPRKVIVKAPKIVSIVPAE